MVTPSLKLLAWYVLYICALCASQVQFFFVVYVWNFMGVFDVLMRLILQNIKCGVEEWENSEG